MLFRSAAVLAAVAVGAAHAQVVTVTTGTTAFTTTSAFIAARPTNSADSVSADVTGDANTVQYWSRLASGTVVGTGDVVTVLGGKAQVTGVSQTATVSSRGQLIYSASEGRVFASNPSVVSLQGASYTATATLGSSAIYSAQATAATFTIVGGNAATGNAILISNTNGEARLALATGSATLNGDSNVVYLSTTFGGNQAGRAQTLTVNGNSNAVFVVGASTQSGQILSVTGTGNTLTGNYGTIYATGPANTVSLGSSIQGYVTSGAKVYASLQGATGYAGAGGTAIATDLINQQGVITIGDGGVGTVAGDDTQGNTAFVNQGGSLAARSGGVATVNNGGVARVAQSARVLVASGGSAVLESSASVTAEPGATLSPADSTQSVVVVGDDPDSGNTVYRAEYAPAPSAAARRARRDLDAALAAGKKPPSIPKKRSICMKRDEEACPVGNGRFKCIDTMTHLESCGGCWLAGEGKDCTTIPHAEGVECIRGGCLVLSCESGFSPSEDGSSCQPSNGRRVRRRVARK